MNIKTPIVDGLNKYLSENHKPWHMPGHKRKSGVCDVGEGIASQTCATDKNNMVENIIQRVQAMDVTEVPGLDDLHCPEDMIRESEEQLKSIYGTEASFYLVNGSTCGIFAAIAACGRGGIIAADNCHKSVRNAAELMGISISYVKTEKIYLNGKVKNDTDDIQITDSRIVDVSEEEDKEKFSSRIRGYISPEELEKVCKSHKNATAVIITSPTYEGIISNIKAISKVTEKYGMYLIVDEAHGAHLPFMDKEKSAVYNGADVVIQSLHKTLASLTQTAILHITNKAVEKNPHIREDMRRFLSFVMSSSPSYVLLASMELAVTDAAKNAGMDIANAAVSDEKAGTGGFEKYEERIINFRKKCEKLKNLRLFAGGEGYDIDITRIVIYQKNLQETAEKGNDLLPASSQGSNSNTGQRSRLTGPELEKMLAEENIVVEMSGLDYVVLISSYVDNEADFVDLYAALEKIDGKIGEKLEEITIGECGNIQVTPNKKHNSMPDTHDIVRVSGTEGEQTNYKEDNHICIEKLKVGDTALADFYVYPPGIPIIAKGEIITAGALSELRELGAAGKKIHMS